MAQGGYLWMLISPDEDRIFTLNVNLHWSRNTDVTNSSIRHLFPVACGRQICYSSQGDFVWQRLRCLS